MVTDAPHSARKFNRRFKDEICRQSSLENTATILAEAAQALNWDLATFTPVSTPSIVLPARIARFRGGRLGWC